MISSKAFCVLSRNRKTFAVSSLVLNLFASQIGEFFLPHTVCLMFTVCGWFYMLCCNCSLWGTLLCCCRDRITCCLLSTVRVYVITLHVRAGFVRLCGVSSSLLCIADVVWSCLVGKRFCCFCGEVGLGVGWVIVPQLVGCLSGAGKFGSIYWVVVRPPSFYFGLC